MKKFIFGIGVFLVCAASAVAQTTSNTPSPNASPGAASNLREQIKDTRQEVRDTRVNVSQEIKNLRSQTLIQVKTLNASTTQQIEANRQTLKNEIQASFAQLQQTIAAKRAGLQTKIDAARTLLQQKLQKIKDQVKENIALRINDQLIALNNLMVDHFLAVLTRLDTILNNISSRADKAQGAGLDVSAVQTVIAAAQKAISNSRTAVNVQAGKTYPIVITGTTASTTESYLKANVGKSRQALHADLVNVRATVVAARDAVQKAAMTLAQIQGIDNVDKENSSISPSPSVSASPSPSASPSTSPSASATPSSSPSESASASPSPSPSGNY